MPPRLVAGSAPRPVPNEVHGHRNTGSEEGRDTPGRRVTAAVLGRVQEHAGRDRRSEGDGDQERDGISRGHNGHDTAARGNGWSPVAPKPLNRNFRPPLDVDEPGRLGPLLRK